MKNTQSRLAVIFYGPPGSGKSTQAKLLAEKLGLSYLDTGDYLRRLLSDPLLKKDRIIRREKKLNESGSLNTPEWVLRVITKRVKEIIALKQGMVFSGSPRTLFEAFGGRGVKGLYDILIGGVGKNNIFVFELDIPFSESTRRNSKRFSCSVCKTPLMGLHSGFKKRPLKSCPFCGGKIIRRRDDNPEIIKARLDEYKARTLPILRELQKRKHRIYKINGIPAPYKIHERVIQILNSKRQALNKSQ